MKLKTKKRKVMNHNNRSTEGNILVVDDTPANLKLLNNLLKDKGYNVRPVLNGRLALSGAKAIPPDLILLDVAMPEMDGYEVCKQLKASAETRDIPIIFLTAKTSTEDIIKGFEVGAEDYVTKPFIHEILLARVNTHLSLRKKTKQLQELSIKDGLTQIANRRYFDEFLNLEWRRCMRDNKPVSLMMVDIDHFKLFNDTYGHQKGDDVLQSVATVIQSFNNRPSDLTARYGGEEFAVVLGKADIKTAEKQAIEICTAIEQLNIVHESSETKNVVTISIGVASLTPTAEYQPADLIKMADDQLYAAKENGRNQVKISALNMK